MLSGGESINASMTGSRRFRTATTPMQSETDAGAPPGAGGGKEQEIRVPTEAHGEQVARHGIAGRRGDDSQGG